MRKIKILVAAFSGLVLLAGVSFALLFFVFPPPIEKLYPPVSTPVYSRDGDLLRVFINAEDNWLIRKSLEELSPQYIEFALNYEDKRFYTHFGVDPFSIMRAMYQNYQAGKIVSGGSTITMQIARMMEPKPRTIYAKVFEAIRALQLETRYSKRELLEIYFNMIPFGGNIVGVGAASLIYFGKEPSKLSAGEAALLSVLPNSPTKTRPDTNRDEAKRARDKALRLFNKRGLLSANKLEESLSEELPQGRRKLPFRAPHFCDMLKRTYPNASRIDSAIDLNIQTLAENLVKKRSVVLKSMGISQVAAVVIDNETSEILALVGSANFFNKSDAGQVNGAMAPRSPGSTLKPFIYGMGIDRGLFTPETLLEDTPVSYGVYSPENYDGLFRGGVTLREALVNSLNVPAVKALKALGADGLYGFMIKAGVTTLKRPESDYGLAMALGGCEVNLVELTNLYSSLSRGGKIRNYQITLNRSKSAFGLTETPLMSEAAAFLISDILSDVKRPDFHACWEFSTSIPKIAWKTGTSYGRKDAWSVGYNKKYSAGVWAGNFSGAGVPDNTGAGAAAPLLFDLFNSLPKANAYAWFEPPNSVGKREVCALSGMPKSHNCPLAKMDFYIKDVSQNTACDMHKRYDIDIKTGHRLCSVCKEGKKTRSQVFEIFPPSLASWLKETGIGIKELPEHNPLCKAVQPGPPPLIVSPSEGVEYILLKDSPIEYQKIKLKAHTSNDVAKLYWYVDGALFWSGSPYESPFYSPMQGLRTFHCADDMGRSSKVSIVIK